MTPCRLAIVLAVVLPVAVVRCAWAAVYPEGPREAVGLLRDAVSDVRRRIRRGRR